MSKRLEELHDRALLRFNDLYSTEIDLREQAIEDRRFSSISGAQWEGDFEYQYENRPQLEVNKIHSSLMEISSEFRKNRIQPRFVSKDDSNQQLAETCTQLFRSDFYMTSGKLAVMNAFDEGTAGGFGAFRLTNEYVDPLDPDDDRQKISVECVYDADISVYFDPDAKKQDKSDARFCFVIEAWDKREYEEEFGIIPASLTATHNTNPDRVSQYQNWVTNDFVRVAEYYEIEEVKQKVHIYVYPNDEEVRILDEDLEDEEPFLKATGAKKTGERKVTIKKVHKYLISADDVLEDMGYIAGEYIPIIPYYGKRFYISSQEYYMGHVRLSKDSQRLKNMLTSKLAEIASADVTEKPIFTPEQVLGHTQMWSNNNIEQYPFYLINPITDVNGNPNPIGALGYTKPPAVPPALASLMSIAEKDMSDLLGNVPTPDAPLNKLPTDQLEALLEGLKDKAHIYIDNMVVAMEHAGRVWLSMARDVFVEEGRVIRGMVDDTKEIEVTILQPSLDDDGSRIMLNDIPNARFDVISQSAPASSDMRKAVVDKLSLLSSNTSDQQTQDILNSAIFANVDLEGMDGFNEFFRMKLIRAGALKPNKEEEEILNREMEAKEPTAQEKLLEAAALKEQAEAMERQANTQLKQAQTDKTKAETAGLIQDSGIKDQNQLLALLDARGTDPRGGTTDNNRLN